MYTLLIFNTPYESKAFPFFYFCNSRFQFINFQHLAHPCPGTVDTGFQCPHRHIEHGLQLYQAIALDIVQGEQDPVFFRQALKGMLNPVQALVLGQILVRGKLAIGGGFVEGGLIVD